MLVIVRADPEKDMDVMAPMVEAFARETCLDEEGTNLVVSTIPDSVSFIAYHDNTPVGMIGMAEDDKAFWGQYLWVDPKYRNGTIAGLLHRAALKATCGKPAKVVASIDLVRMYEKAGYVTTHHVMQREN